MNKHITKFSIRILCFSLVALMVFSCKKDEEDGGKMNHKASTGSSANALLSDKGYTKLKVQIQYMPNHKPDQKAIDRLETFLSERLRKPGGIEFVLSQVASLGKSSYSINDIKSIEDANRTVFSEGETIGTYFLFLDADFSGNSNGGKVLGVAYYNTSMALFEKTIKDLTGGFGEPDTDKLETVVMNHEFGHILGLVNNGTSMQDNHQDTAHGAHCDNEDCLMNWSAETGDAISNFLGTSGLPGLDQNCVNDLKANGGK